MSRTLAHNFHVKAASCSVRTENLREAVKHGTADARFLKIPERIEYVLFVQYRTYFNKHLHKQRASRTHKIYAKLCEL